LSAEVSLEKMPLKRTIESFFIIRASPRRSYQCIETETAERMKGKLGEEGGGADKISFSAPDSLIHSAAADTSLMRISND